MPPTYCYISPKNLCRARIQIFVDRESTELMFQCSNQVDSVIIKYFLIDPLGNLTFFSFLFLFSETIEMSVTVDELRTTSDVDLERQNAKLQNTHHIVHSLVSPVENVKKLDSSEVEKINKDMKIFELTEQQIELLLSGSDFYTIKGSDSESCGVFSRDKSFTLRSGETSNTLLFASDITLPKEGVFRLSPKII